MNKNNILISFPPSLNPDDSATVSFTVLNKKHEVAQRLVNVHLCAFELLNILIFIQKTLRLVYLEFYSLYFNR